jgi:polyhydroxyalkanoate synthesis regulator protein
MMENMNAMNPMSKMPGFEAVKAQQEAFLKAMTGGFGAAGWTGGAQEDEKSESGGEDLDDIKKQLAALQEKLSKMK